ncbi:MAG: YkvA family protein [Pseudomonadota bacterium]
MVDTDFKARYSDQRFWEKVKGGAKVAGKAALEPALKMYYSATDKDTPVWAKSAIYGALGYFISPIDAIPDLLPLVGYTDDLGVLLAAAATVAAYIKAEHVQKAQATLKPWFG